MERSVTAIVLAAGRGERLGEDKALMRLGSTSAIEAVVARCRAAGCVEVLVVRRLGAAALPQAIAARVLEVETEEMIATLRAAVGALAGAPPAAVLVFPIDHAMAGLGAVRAVVAAAPHAAITLPICRERPGHPIGLRWDVACEVQGAGVRTLRDVIRRDPARVAPVPVEDGWVLRDIDLPEDLLAARGALEHSGLSACELMARHRSRRGYRSESVGDQQLRWLVDSARHASTSSFMQAASVVVVRDPERKRRAAVLCADQAHIHRAPVFLAVCADLHRLAVACRRHGTELSAKTLEVFVQATVDAALFGQNLQLAAESEGLGACMIGAARNHPVELAELLGLPRHVYVVFGMTLGWPDDDPVPRDRLPLDAVLHVDRYATGAIDAALDDADERMRAWARRVNARGGDQVRKIDERRGWSDRMAYLFGTGRPPKGREHLLEHLRTLGFGIDGEPPANA